MITQNVDGLHRLAGSADLLEVHGSIASASCPACGRTEPREVVESLLPLPRCADCGAVLKPDVVMFGELLPSRELDRATSLAREAALLLVVGSSLEVWPVAGLPEETLANGGTRRLTTSGRIWLCTNPPRPCSRRRARRSGRGALDRLHVEHAGAGLADLPLHLVRDTGLLKQHVHALRDVLVGDGVCGGLHLLSGYDYRRRLSDSKG